MEGRTDTHVLMWSRHGPYGACVAAGCVPRPRGTALPRTQPTSPEESRFLLVVFQPLVFVVVKHSLRCWKYLAAVSAAEEHACLAAQQMVAKRVGKHDCHRLSGFTTRTCRRRCAKPRRCSRIFWRRCCSSSLQARLARANRSAVSARRSDPKGPTTYYVVNQGRGRSEPGGKALGGDASTFVAGAASKTSAKPPKYCSSCAGFGRLNVGICLISIAPRNVGRICSTNGQVLTVRLVARCQLRIREKRVWHLARTRARFRACAVLTVTTQRVVLCLRDEVAFYGK
jgi:hypothetical protein